MYNYVYCPTQGGNISDLTPNSASSPASTLAASNFGSHHNDEKEGAKEGGRYNMIVRGYCNRMPPNLSRFHNITLWFFNGCTKSDKEAY